MYRRSVVKITAINVSAFRMKTLGLYLLSGNSIKETCCLNVIDSGVGTTLFIKLPVASPVSVRMDSNSTFFGKA